MNQLDFFNSLGTCLPDQYFHDTRSFELSQELERSGLTISTNYQVQNQVLLALIQICYKLDRELQIQLQKNKLLLSSMFYNSVNIVKKQVGEDINIVRYSVTSQQQLEEQANQVKQRKLAVNDTKNISKNFGKAVITFIQKNPQKVAKILKHHNLNVTEFSQLLKQRKKKLISIKQLRSLWLNSQFQYARPFRQISQLFLRKASLKYIFGSRVADYAGHLKYRKRILQALHRPEQFHSIKQ